MVIIFRSFRFCRFQAFHLSSVKSFYIRFSFRFSVIYPKSIAASWTFLYSVMTFNGPNETTKRSVEKIHLSELKQRPGSSCSKISAVTWIVKTWMNKNLNGNSLFWHSNSGFSYFIKICIIFCEILLYLDLLVLLNSSDPKPPIWPPCVCEGCGCSRWLCLCLMEINGVHAAVSTFWDCV